MDGVHVTEGLQSVSVNLQSALYGRCFWSNGKQVSYVMCCFVLFYTIWISCPWNKKRSNCKINATLNISARRVKQHNNTLIHFQPLEVYSYFWHVPICILYHQIHDTFKLFWCQKWFKQLKSISFSGLQDYVQRKKISCFLTLLLKDNEVFDRNILSHTLSLCGRMVLLYIWASALLLLCCMGTQAVCNTVLSLIMKFFNLICHFILLKFSQIKLFNQAL